MNALLPFEATQKSVALAMAEVIKKKRGGKRMAEQPFATAFFRFFFGTTTPARSKLFAICDSSDMTIFEIKHELDRFIESNGRSYTALSKTFKEKAFPCLANLDRFEAHFELKETQKQNIEAKAKLTHNDLMDELKSNILNLAPRDLTEWVNETEEQISNHDQISLLAHWHQEKANDDLPFRDLYSGFSSPMEIAVDLSYI